MSNGEWEEFRAEDADPIGVEELKRLNLKGMPEDALIWVMDDYFPDAKIRREGKCIVCEIEEHLYTKYWEHKFSAYAFAEAMGARRSAAFARGSPFRTSVAR